jgi:hypothetical protein
VKITRRELFVGSIFIAYLGHEARAETSLSDSEAAKVAAAALAAHTWILIPLGTPFPTYVQGDVTAHPPLGQNAITSAMPTDPVAGERVGRHGAIEPSG